MKFSLIIILTSCLSSCVNLKPYETRYVNSEEMDIGFDNLENLSNNPKTYREGSQGGNTGKSGGGCGCN